VKQITRSAARPEVWPAVAAILVTAVATGTMQAKEWEAVAGAESPDRGRQALAFMPNELWVQTGDSVRWTFQTHERHTVTFLPPTQLRPALFGPTFEVEIGCPGTTPDGAAFDGSACVHSGVLLSDETSGTPTPTYSVTFPAAGNFKFVCLAHADMTGVVHVLSPSETLPHDQNYYDRQALNERTDLMGEASLLRGHATSGEEGRIPSNGVAAGIGEIMTTNGAGSKTVSLMRFVRSTIEVRVGDTVEWTSLDPSINHTVTFGTEPVDPRPASSNVTLTSDGARQASIASPTDSVNSGYLSPAPQDRAGLAPTVPGVTRFRVTFTSPGTFSYICAIHDTLDMKGTVIVQP
jgi:plastocyanin